MSEASPVPVTYLFSRECPSHDEGLRLLEEAARDAGVAIAVDPIEVRDDAQAQALAFIGSPTYVVAGSDPFAAEGPAHAPQHDACRAYRRADGRIGPLPSRAELADALRRVAA